jgi:hypothetical protein
MTRKIITLYHGTTHFFDVIDMSKCKPYKDFGTGFYLSEVREQAVKLAFRNLAIEKLRFAALNRICNLSALLYSYEFSPDALKDLSAKKFAKADKEWVRFVVMNRTSAEKKHSYDIVTGPTANDNTRNSIDLFIGGYLGDKESDDAMNILLQLLKPQVLPRQFLFATEKAVARLKLIRRDGL